MFHDRSDLSQATERASKPATFSLATGRLRPATPENPPARPSTPIIPPLHEFLQSHGSKSGEELAKDSSVRALQHAVACGRADVVSWFLSKGADMHKRDSSGATLLHTAVEHGHIDLVGLLLDRGAEVNSTDSKGRAPMHLVPAGRADIIEFLVRSGSRVDIKDASGNSGLMSAVLQGQAERVRTYLTSGADVNAVEPIPASIKVVGDTELPPILVAIHEKHTGVLKVLIEYGADLRPSFKETGRTVLHCAAARPNPEVVSCLVLAKVDVEARNKDGSTALHEMAMHGNGPHSKKVIQILLNAGANIEAKCRGFTPLHLAAYNNALKVVKVLLDAGASIRARSNDLRTPLHLAAQNGWLRVVMMLLDAGADIHEKDGNGETTLHIACEMRSDRNLSVIKYLLDHGASVSEAADLDRRRGDLPPHRAASRGFKEAVELFLDTGFDKVTANARGWQMIHLAADKGHVDILKLLLERGTATSCSTRSRGARPLHLAAGRGHVEAISVLCKFGANVNDASWKDGGYPIHDAAYNGHAEVISLLHKSGATIDALDDQSQTPLLEAAKQRHSEVVRVLLEHGANIDVQSKNRGFTSLHIAAQNDDKEMVKLLLERGANPKLMARDGRTARALARKLGHREVCQVLEKIRIQPKSGASDEAPDSDDSTKVIYHRETTSKK